MLNGPQTEFLIGGQPQYKMEKQTIEQLILVQDTILGSRYELQEVEVIDGVETLSNMLSQELGEITKDEQ